MNMSGCLKLWGSVLSRLFVSLKVPKENFGHNICVLTTFFGLWVHIFRTKEEKLAKETKTICSLRPFPMIFLYWCFSYEVFWRHIFLPQLKGCALGIFIAPPPSHVQIKFPSGHQISNASCILPQIPQLLPTNTAPPRIYPTDVKYMQQHINPHV